jgi:hypothetical protein
MVDHLGNFGKGDFPEQIIVPSSQGCVKPMQFAYFILGSLVNHRWPGKLYVKTYTNIHIFTVSGAGPVLHRIFCIQLAKSYFDILYLGNANISAHWVYKNSTSFDAFQ